MRRLIYAACLAILLACGLLTQIPEAQGVERFPPPEFKETNHQLPTLKVPMPDTQETFYLDQVLPVALLFVALCVATWLTMVVRRRRWVILLAVTCLAYFGFWRAGCICPVGATQNVADGLIAGSACPWSAVAMFILPLIFALAFGRVFCSGVCPLGAIQDLVAIRPLPVPAWLDRPLSLLRWVVLAAIVSLAVTGGGYLLCRYDPFVGFFRLAGPMEMWVVGVVVLLVGVVITRPFCRWICPYGAILGLLSRLSWRKVTITPEDCISCRLCETTCPMGAIEQPTEAAPRRFGRLRLATSLLLLPLWIFLGLAVGQLLIEPASRMNPEVPKLLKTIKTTQEQAEMIPNVEDELEKLATKLAVVQKPFHTAMPLAGGFVGLVIGLALVSLCVRRSRTIYEPKESICIACGRCWSSCPIEQKRRKGERDSC